MKRILVFLFLNMSFAGAQVAHQNHSHLTSYFWEVHNHPELQWYSFETEHFVLHYHEGAERTAKVIAKVAEDVHGPITALYGFTPPEKTNFIVRDHDDYSNGAAYYYDNKVEIWASSMSFELRGTHDWLRNVITHEYTHMIQLQAARKFSRKVPAAYLQWIGYEKEKRPDVLYGYPNTIVSYPIAFTVMPSWFAEGVAQYQIPGLKYEHWDSHRDMLLRTAAVDKKILTLGQMSSFGKNSIGNERAYNQGFSFSTYLAENYGLESLKKATDAMAKKTQYSFSRALKVATGKDGQTLYDEWKIHLEKHYANSLQFINKNKVEGEIIEPNGIGNFYPRWSDDGRTIAYISTGGSDYISLSSLVLRDMVTNKKKVLAGGANQAFDWSKDGTSFIYSSQKNKTKHGSRLFDLYLYDLNKKKNTRLTKKLRGHSPAFSPDAKKAAFVINGDGTQNLAVINLKTKEVERLTQFKNGEQVYYPRWSPDGMSILFSFTPGEGRSLRVMHLADKKVEIIAATGPDNRDGIWARDGKKVYFASDRSGIFNIYSKDLQTGEIAQLTNVVGGAFMPDISADGILIYSLFVADGYKIAKINKPQPIEKSLTTYQKFRSKPATELLTDQLAAMNLNGIAAPNYDDKKLPAAEIKPYQNRYSAFSLIPRVVRDYGTTKLGSYFFSSDLLDNYNVLGGFGVNSKFDLDAFGLVNYNKFGPTLFLEAYNQRRNTEENNPYPSLRDKKDKFRYNLTEIYLGMRHRLFPGHNLEVALNYGQYNAKINSYTQDAKPYSFGYTYHIGRGIQTRYEYFGIAPAIDASANPRAGRAVTLMHRAQSNSFIDGFEVNSSFGTVQEVYTDYNYNEINIDWKEYLGLWKKHSLYLRFKGGFIDREVDSFYNLYNGGLDGNRGYPFYSIEGRKSILTTLAYRLPLFWNIDKSLAQIYFDKFYVGIFADYGNAFVEDSIELKDFKRSVGTQLRLEMFSFYGYPTKLFFDAAYGLDEFQNRGITYGKEWRYYFGITFDYFD
ncbi:MAG: hypothetical protein DWQ05_18395 [Calditrichaeota bacterium]|nr:MAG: hypothetical protein DWQ05_18395 [Calditrichota bacterium]